MRTDNSLVDVCRDYRRQQTRLPAGRAYYEGWENGRRA